VERVVEHLASMRTLLVLDNCEHLVLACAELVGRLLRLSSGVYVLATSREPLRIPGETIWRVAPLATPDSQDDLALATDCEAVRLFVDRAQACVPSFSVSASNLRSVAAICQAMDGLPLAIELVAARLKLLSTDQLYGRLHDSLKLLSGGSRTSPARQRTLRAMLDWSYELLSNEERVLFERLSVFAGGWTLEAAEQVGDGGDPQAGDVLDRLAQLVDASLVQSEPGADGAARYRFLQTVQQYSREKLNTRSEQATLDARRCHAVYFRDLVERSGQDLLGPQQAVEFEHFELEHDNLRAALTWAVECDEMDLALRLATGLVRFWTVRCHFS